MGAEARGQRSSLLLAQLRWFISLRWVVGATVIVGALVEWQWLGWYSSPGRFVGLGLAIVGYNAALYAAVRGASGARAQRRVLPSAAWLITVAWVQILLDLGCLTLLTLSTGGGYSPFLGFYVFHMVFASLLLPRRMGYAGALAATLMVGGGLALSGQWPTRLEAWLILAGWAVTVFLTVYLTNRITQSLRRQHRRLVRQNRRVSIMSRRLKAQQDAMIQHEKMVALGQMAAGVAHEITNPLASMDSLLELMQRHPERDVPDRIATLREQARRIKQIMQQMTTFAHPSQGRSRAVGVNEVVEAALEMVRFDQRIRPVEIERRFSPQANDVQVESHAMEQVIINLVLNALDAMEGSREPRLILRTARDGDGGLIEVSDNGRGIAPEHLSRLFEPFFTTKPVGKGTGLGLAISYSLVRRLGGRIDVTSEIGKGATFTVRWPAGGRSSYPREAGPAPDSTF